MMISSTKKCNVLPKLESHIAYSILFPEWCVLETPTAEMCLSQDEVVNKLLSIATGKDCSVFWRNGNQGPYRPLLQGAI